MSLRRAYLELTVLGVFVAVAACALIAGPAELTAVAAPFFVAVTVVFLIESLLLQRWQAATNDDRIS